MKGLPKDFHEPETAVTPEAKQELVRKIQAGKSPRTREGVVMHMPGDKVWKYKDRPETTGYITGTFPGKGKRQATVGGLTFRRNGPEGRVGSGLTDAQLRDMARNIRKYLGKPIRVEHQGELPSGLLRAPTFAGFETDKPEEKAAQARAKRIGKALLPYLPILGIQTHGVLASERAGKELGEQWEKAPKSRFPFLLPRPPRGVKRLTTMEAVDKYYTDHAPRKRWVMRPLAERILEGKLRNAYFEPAGKPGGPRAVVIHKGAPKLVFEHEYGHGKDYLQQMKEKGKWDYGANVSGFLKSVLLGAKGSPRYAAEVRAWDLAGVPEDHPLRRAALRTYSTEMDTLANTVRLGLPAIWGIETLQRPGVRQKLLRRLKGVRLGRVFKRLMKRGQAPSAVEGAQQVTLSRGTVQGPARPYARLQRPPGLLSTLPQFTQEELESDEAKRVAGERWRRNFVERYITGKMKPGWKRNVVQGLGGRINLKEHLTEKKPLEGRVYWGFKF
jgi:hypothetical protein